MHRENRGRKMEKVCENNIEAAGWIVWVREIGRDGDVIYEK